MEGYNESRKLGTAKDTMEALYQQNFPLKQVEIILIGSSAQTQEWQKLYSGETKFFAVKTVEVSSKQYYEIKNVGSAIASGEIIAFTDSDVRPLPTWIAGIVESISNGADVVIGPSLFRQEGGFSPNSPLMRALASITWGWVVSKSENGKELQAVGFMDHNVALRANVFQKHQYRTDLGRICTSPLLYRELVNAGLKISLQPLQQAAHHFSWKYWLFKLHFRFGHEVFRLRRLDKQYPNQWIAQTKILEPLVTMIWHVMLDIPRWFRYSSLFSTHFIYRLAVLPIVIFFSVIARTCEMLGMYCTILAPRKIQRWAENV